MTNNLTPAENTAAEADGAALADVTKLLPPKVRRIIYIVCGVLAVVCPVVIPEVDGVLRSVLIVLSVVATAAGSTTAVAHVTTK